jgi:hypothetical protein
MNRELLILTFLLQNLINGCGLRNEEKTTQEISSSCETMEIPDVSQSSGQLIFSLSSQFANCDVSGYIVGYQDQLKIKSTIDGRFYISNVPSGNHDVFIIAGAAMSLAGKSRPSNGKRINKVSFLSGIRNELGEIELPKLGAIAGNVTLEGQTDNSGIDVYIPGTSMIAKTDSIGNYVIEGVPVGTHNLYFEKDGYHRGQIEGISVDQEQTTKLTSIGLILSTGAEGLVELADGAEFYDSLTVPVIIAASPNAVLMKVSEDSDFTGASWLALRTNFLHTFSSAGSKTLRVKFSDANGLESSPFSAKITIDDTAPSFTVEQETYSGRGQVTLRIQLDGIKAQTVSRIRAESPTKIESAQWIDFSETLSVPYSETLRIEIEDRFQRVSSVEKPITYVAKLSVSRTNVAAASLSGKIIFAGGYSAEGSYSNVVDEFDTTTKKWATSALSVGRSGIAATVNGNVAMFAGGNTTSNDYSSVVDIYDNTTGQWSTSNLSVARGSIAAASLGTKSFFAGGRQQGNNFSSIVDVYDHNSKSWTTVNLSVGRYGVAAAAAGDKLLFAGGYELNNGPSDVVDIFDGTNWTTATLSAPRGMHAAAAVGNKILILGGEAASTSSNVVDIYDTTNGTWTHSTFTGARFALCAATVGATAVFAGGSSGSGYSKQVDTYNIESNLWTTGQLSSARPSCAAGSGNGLLLVAGGSTASGAIDTVDVYHSQTGTWTTGF